MSRNREIFTDQVSARLKEKYSQKSEETVFLILQLENVRIRGIKEFIGRRVEFLTQVMYHRDLYLYQHLCYLGYQI